jgi:HAD superfamily hydrolase (TIGR01509 family)
VPIQTVFLDAGGVLVNPNWSRVSETLARHGVDADAAALAAAEPHAKKRLDTGATIDATNDQQRGWTYFNLVLEAAGVALSDATAAALAELHIYHQELNLWESVPDEVLPSLAALRAHGFQLVVLSNANGTLHRAFDRLGLTSAFDVIFDSYREGIEKPDPRFFQIALDRAGARADLTMHVGDL